MEAAKNKRLYAIYIDGEGNYKERGTRIKSDLVQQNTAAFSNI